MKNQKFTLLTFFFVIVFCKAYCQPSNENLFYTCKVWGFVKYNHPAIRSGKVDCDDEFDRISGKMKSVKTKKERNKLLSEWISGLGEFEVSKAVDTTVYLLKPDDKWLDDKRELGAKLSKQLKEIKYAKRDTLNYYVRKEPDDSRPLFDKEKSYPEATFDDTDQYALLALARYWNIVEYYFPYKNLMDHNWDTVLLKSIGTFRKISNENEYYTEIRKLTTLLSDCHVGVDGNAGYYKFLFKENHLFAKAAPVTTMLLDNRVVVTELDDTKPECGLKLGDIILSVNGVKSEKILDSCKEYTSFSNFNSAYHYSLSSNFLASHIDSLTVSCLRNDSIITVNALCFMKDWQRKPIKDPFTIKDSIAYLSPAGVGPEEIDSVLNQIVNTKGLIIDLRIYPQYIFDKMTNFLLPTPTEFVKFSLPVIDKPGYFIEDPNKAGFENSNYYKGKVIIIVNCGTMSHGEFSAMAYRCAPRTIIIGEPTAGADGDITQIPLPKDLTTLFSSLGVYYPDGGQTQRVGVRIDEIVKPTIKGIREGRDELLERALEMMNISLKKGEL